MMRTAETAGDRASVWGRDVPRLSPGFRIGCFVTGIVLPTVCIVCASGGMSATGQQPWQSGQTRDYAALLLRLPAIAPLLIPVLYSMVCMGAWLLKPEMVTYFGIRFGIYSGVVVSLFFFGLILTTSESVTLVAAPLAAMVLVIPWMAVPLLKRFRRFSLLYLLGVMTACAIVAMVLRGFVERYTIVDGVNVLAVGLLIVLAGSPSLIVITYGACAFWLSNHWKASHPKRLIKLLGALFGWGSITAISLRTAVALMYSEYTKLPTVNPNCYLTAAAQNANFRVRRVFGDSIDLPGLSRQTKRLKLLECVLCVTWPRGHARVRQVYDQFGPSLAQRVGSHPWLATMTFLAFVPLEWGAVVLSFVLRVPVRL